MRVWGAALSERTRTSDSPGFRVAFRNVLLSAGICRTGLSTARPLLAGVKPRAEFHELLEAMLPLYHEFAMFEVTTGDRPPSEIAKEILDARRWLEVPSQKCAFEACPFEGGFPYTQGCGRKIDRLLVLHARWKGSCRPALGTSVAWRRACTCLHRHGVERHAARAP